MVSDTFLTFLFGRAAADIAGRILAVVLDAGSAHTLLLTDVAVVAIDIGEWNASLNSY